jgi:hypothetical protein
VSVLSCFDVFHQLRLAAAQPRQAARPPWFQIAMSEAMSGMNAHVATHFVQDVMPPGQ